jgi:CRP-like cAMP-binding protein
MVTIADEVTTLSPGSASPFDSLPEPGRAALRAIGREREFARGEPIVAQGARCAGFHVLLAGRAKMVRDLVAGRTVLLALFSPGELFATAPALSGEVSDAAIVALEPCRTLEVEREALLARLAEDPSLLGLLLPALAGHHVECRNCIVELAGYRVEARFALLFLRLAREVGEPEGGEVRIPVRLTRQELADLAGTTLETAIRVFSRWHQAGLLETRSDGFLLRDPAALERAADGAATLHG